MAKIIDITEKLSFDENPHLVIKGVDLEVNTDAPTVLKIMGIVGEEDITPKDIVNICQLVFNEEDRAKLDALKLSFKDYQKVIESATALIVGDSEEGE